MKKMIVLVLIVMASIPSMAAINLITNNADFGIDLGYLQPYGEGQIPGWASYVHGRWAEDGILVIGWDQNVYICQNTVDIVQANSLYTLTATARCNNDSGGQVEGFKLQIQDADASYTNVVTQDFWFDELGDVVGQPGQWRTVSIQMNSAAFPGTVGHKLCLAVSILEEGRWSNPYGFLYLDQMTLSVEAAEDPIPANGSTVPTVTSAISWKNPETITKCDLYFGDAADANEFNYKTKLTKYVISSPTLPPARQTWTIPTPWAPLSEKTYKWVVDCYRGTPTEPNLPHYQVWSFTATALPLIVTNPAEQIVAQTGTATFTGAFDSITPPQVQWYKEAGETDILMDNPDDPDVTITTTNVGDTYTTTMAIANVEIADGGQYYYKATNEGGSISSLPAWLVVKRKVAHWALDALNGSDLCEDSSGEGHHADPNGTPVFEPGVNVNTNNAMKIDADNGWATAGTWNPSEKTGELTVSCWAKWDAPESGNQVIISKANNWNGSTMMWQIACMNNGSLLLFTGPNNAQLSLPAGTMRDGEWQYVAFTYNGTTGILYSNAVSDANSITPTDSGNFTLGAGVDATVWIGARGNESATVPTEKFTGLIDDVQIFNYAKDAHGVVDMYNAVIVPDKNFCVNTYPSVYDTNRDCLITLVDFVEFAKGWLDCGLYPVCP